MNTETNYADHFYADISNDIDTLRKNVNENPFSSVAQFLLLYNYKKNNDPSFEKYAKQTAIYFNNIPWIQYQLLGNNTDHFSPPLLPSETHEEIIPVNGPIIQNPIQGPETENDATKETTNISDNIQTLGTDEIPETNFTADEPIIQNPVQEPETGNEATNETSNISDNIQTLGTDEIPETNFTADEPIIENSNQEPENEEEIVAFEPLHTVDYFASQGIKISEEALENDHLGQQVKSFTAWLKSMKKLHPGQLPEQNEVIEKIIQSSAEISNQNANVLTEAMAEVLLKQNKKQKAIEMYEKLSLMNPSKSSYFAAKIESLKTI